MTDLEIRVSRWLTRHGIIFDFQSSLLGGRMEFGGAVADFVLLEEGIILRIMGGYYHSGVEANARDKAQRASLEGLGYRVVDIAEEDLTRNLDLVMTKAIVGDEMSPIDSALQKGMMGSMGGMKGISRMHNPDAHVLSSHTTPEARTDEALNNTLAGTVAYDGGIECDCRFQYGEATEAEGEMCWIWPFTRSRAYRQLSPWITETFAVGGVYSHSTDWIRNKLTGDAFNTYVDLIPSTVYCYRAEVKNPAYSDTGEDIKFIGV